MLEREKVLRQNTVMHTHDRKFKRIMVLYLYSTPYKQVGY